MHAWLVEFVDWYRATLESGGYPLIALLMAIESSLVPLPSEVVIPPAAHFARAGGYEAMTLPGIVAAGTIGSWLGAAIMYWASRLLGRPLVMRYGRFVLITPRQVERAERWAEQFGALGIFIARLLPVVRHLIGIPAGVVRMDFLRYTLFTLIGSALWCAVLCYLGLRAGEDEALLAGDARRWGLWLGGVVTVLGALYYFAVHRYMRAKNVS
jgi:membrane protein DedA with SNARE-associated domain